MRIHYFSVHCNWIRLRVDLHVLFTKNIWAIHNQKFWIISEEINNHHRSKMPYQLIFNAYLSSLEHQTLLENHLNHKIEFEIKNLKLNYSKRKC